MCVIRWCHGPAPQSEASSSGELGLSQDQVDFFNANGYLVVPDFWTRDTCDALIRRANEIVADFEPETVSVFSTNEQVRAARARAQAHAATFVSPCRVQRSAPRRLLPYAACTDTHIRRPLPGQWRQGDVLL